MDSLSEQSRVVSGAAMPVRREGSKPPSNKENLDKKLLLRSTETRSYNDLVNSSFSALLTSDDFDVKKDYPNTASKSNSLSAQRGDAVCSTAAKPLLCVEK